MLPAWRSQGEHLAPAEEQVTAQLGKLFQIPGGAQGAVAARDADEVKSSVPVRSVNPRAAQCQASVAILGSVFLKKHGIQELWRSWRRTACGACLQDALQAILRELEDGKPSDPWASLKAALSAACRVLK